MTDRINPEPWLTEHYVCEDCGAQSHDRPIDCCNTCILVFFFDNPNASNFNAWREPIEQGGE